MFLDLVISQLFFFLHLLLPGFLTCLIIFNNKNTLLFHILGGFCISLILNHITALGIYSLNLNFDIVIYFLIGYCSILILTKHFTILCALRNLNYSDTKLVFFPCLFLFLILYINGGLLVIHSDAWWHMSFANKLSFSNQIYLDQHHLSGLEIGSLKNYFSYLPGWHLILALLQQSSGQPLTSIWHNIASFLIVITFISYFLFAKSLSKNNSIALMAAILLSLLFGGLNSYFRVSPWPGNVSYAIWYFLYYLTFSLFSEFENQQRSGFFNFLTFAYQANRSNFLLIIACVYLILTIHASEMLWFAVSFVFYFLISSYIRTPSKDVGNDLTIITAPVLSLLASACILFFSNKLGDMNLDLGLVLLQLIIFSTLGLILNFSNINSTWQKIVLFCCAILLFSLNVDITQISYLFVPPSELLSTSGFHYPYEVNGKFGYKLLLPQWEHQLREGVIFAGLISLFAATYLFYHDQNRMNTFLFANVFMSYIVLVSPYLFTFINQFTPHTSTYRVNLLIFHPIILSCLFYKLYFLAINEHSKEKYDL